MYSLFDGVRWVSIPIGILWATLVANMYLLLLYTVSPTLLPVKKKNGKRSKEKAEQFSDRSSRTGFSAVMLFRIGFISLLATIIAQPLNVLILSPFSSNSLQNFRTAYQVNMLIASDSSIIRQEIEIQKRFYDEVAGMVQPSDAASIAGKTNLLNGKVAEDKFFLTESKRLLDSLNHISGLSHTKANKMKGDSLRDMLSVMISRVLESDSTFSRKIESIELSEGTLGVEFSKFKRGIIAAIDAKKLNYRRLNDLLSRSNFYIKKIQIILNENPFSWLITIFICLTFLLPIYFKFKIRDQGGFYERKRDIEHRIVLSEYNKFKKTYALLLSEFVSISNALTYERIASSLILLKKVNSIKYELELSEVLTELKDEGVEKYEYWEDHPFRTKNKNNNNDYGSEEDLLKVLYPEP
jgi:hypothetical protein